MSTVTDDISAFLAQPGNGTLATIKRSGLPQLSVVTYAWCPDDDDGRAVVRISTTADRVKVANLRRDPRASFIVSRDWSYAVVEGSVELSAVSAAPDDDAVEELIRVYRDAGGGEHPDWDEYRQAMVTDRRLVVRIVVDHAYGMVRS